MIESNAITSSRDGLEVAVHATDSELLMQFARHGDEGAFETLVRNHQTMVMQVCRHLLRNEHDAEEAFQATFLILVRRARSIRKASSVASWLYKVAYRTALAAARRNSRRRETALHDEPAYRDDSLAAVHEQDMQRALHEELSRLPAAHRAPLVLCYLEGKTRRQAAEELECTEATVKARLARARRSLRMRLSRRGVALSVAMATALAARSAAASAGQGFVQQTVSRCVEYAASGTLASTEAQTVVSLAHQGARIMFVSNITKSMAVAGGVLAVSVMFAVLHASEATQAGSGEGLQLSVDGGEDTKAGTATSRFEPIVAANETNDEPTEKKSTTDPDDVVDTDPSLSAKATGDARLIIKPGDRVRIRVIGTLRDKPIDGVFYVSHDGKVALGPHYGRSVIGGMTVEDAEAKIEKELKRHLRDPHVMVTFSTETRDSNRRLEAIENELRALRELLQRRSTSARLPSSEASAISQDELNAMKVSRHILSLRIEAVNHRAAAKGLELQALGESDEKKREALVRAAKEQNARADEQAIAVDAAELKAKIDDLNQRLKKATGKK